MGKNGKFNIVYAPIHTWLKKMYNKQFWENFIAKNGDKFSDSENMLFYLYSDETDLEEVNCEITIFSDEILEVNCKFHEDATEDEPVNDWVEIEYIPMVSIKNVRLFLDF